MLDGQALNGFADLLRGVRGAPAVRVIQDGREFLAAIARDHVERPTHTALNGVRYFAQRRIAGLVPVTVVVGFEVIDIDQQERERTAVLRGLSPEPWQIIVELPPVLGPGEHIVLRELRDQPPLEERPPGTLLDMLSGDGESDDSDDGERRAAVGDG